MARQKAYTETFQSLGQLIHLIQDAASPAHTRNDAHLCCILGVGDRDELHVWAEVAANRNQALALPSQQFDPSILTAALPPNPLAPVPIARILDTERYRQTGVPEAGLDIGLAEYSNANFFSDDTVFSDLPFPAVSSVVLGDPELDPKTGEQRRYFKKVGDGELIDHLALPSALYEFLPEPLNSRKKGLDDNVLHDYATKLLPRAVGYSAGLIDYFFRGQLMIAPVDPTHIRVTNLSDEPMQSGTIEVYSDSEQGVRAQLVEPYVLVGPIGPGQSTLPIAVPSFAESGLGRYTAVFRGRLGAEDDAVVGVSGLQWVEEWDQGLTGRHPWYQTTTDPGEMNALPPGSVVQTIVSDGVLTQENTRPAGTERLRPGSSWLSSQTNQSYVGLTDFAPLTSPYRDIFPLRVTPKTDLVVKVDTMSINVPVAVPQCPENTWGNGASQYVSVIFDNGYLLELTVPGQQRYLTDSYNPVFLTLGQETRINLYEVLQARGVSVSEPRAVKLVLIVQHFQPPCEPTPEDQSQLLQVDSLRFIEGP
jgi:hypothetical protein